MRPIIHFCNHPTIAAAPQGQLVEKAADTVVAIIAGLQSIFDGIPVTTPIRFEAERGHVSALPSHTGHVPSFLSVLAKRAPEMGVNGWLDLLKYQPDVFAGKPVVCKFYRDGMSRENEFGTRHEIRLMETAAGTLYAELLSFLRAQIKAGRNVIFHAEEPDVPAWAYSLARSAWRLNAQGALEGGMVEESLMAAARGEVYQLESANLRDKRMAGEVDVFHRGTPTVQIVGFRGVAHRTRLTEELRKLGIELDARGEEDKEDDTWRPRDFYRLQGCPAYDSPEGRKLLALDLAWMAYRSGQDIKVPGRIYSATPDKVEEWIDTVGRRWNIIGAQRIQLTRTWVDSL